MIFDANGGREASIFLRKLADKISEKTKGHKFTTTTWIRRFRSLWTTNSSSISGVSQPFQRLWPSPDSYSFSSYSCLKLRKFRERTVIFLTKARHESVNLWTILFCLWAILFLWVSFLIVSVWELWATVSNWVESLYYPLWSLCVYFTLDSF